VNTLSRPAILTEQQTRGSGFTPTPGFDAQSALNQLSDAGRPRGSKEAPGPVTPTPAMTIDQIEVDGAMVVVAEVEELSAAEKPCFMTAQGKERGTYMRLADGDHRLDTYSVFQLSVLTVPSEADREPVPEATIADLDTDLVDRTIARLKTNRPRSLDGTSSDRHVLERIGAIDRGTGSPTLGGILALGSFPQQFFPQLMISFASYPGGSKDVVVGDERMIDRSVLEGSIPDMIDDAVAAVVRNLRVRRVSHGAGARNVPEIPIDASREAITNSVMHRDYSPMARGDQVRVELYPDHLEVHSPGGLWGGQSINAIFAGQSRSRNSVLARLLTDVPFTDRDETVGENAGSGIPRMLGEMTRNGLPAPRFSSVPAEFVAVLDRFGLLNPETRDWLDSLDNRVRTPIGDNALALIHHLGSVTVDELRRQLAIDTLDAQNALDELASANMVKFERGTYRLIRTTGGQDDLSTVERAIVGALTGDVTMTVQDLSVAVERTPGTLRPHLRNLIARGVVVATAPPTSRRRAYRLAGT